MDFYTLDDYTYSCIQELIDNEVEENIHLDYKASGSLSKEDKKRTEITKDISAFANSDGGIIVYGLTEKEHKPESISYIDGSIYTKEWLENVLLLIQPRIEGILIFPIRHEGNLKESIYVVKIPRSNNAPHMAIDKRYYKRFNFQSVPMEDYEVKDVIFRHHSPELKILGASLEEENTEIEEGCITFTFTAWIKNVGKTLCKEYKLSNLFFNLPDKVSCSYKAAESLLLPTCVNDYCFRITSLCKETVFPDEVIEVGHYQIHIPTQYYQNFDRVYLKLTVRYEDGGKYELLTKPMVDSELFIDNPQEIEKYIRKEHPEFNLLSVL